MSQEIVVSSYRTLLAFEASFSLVSIGYRTIYAKSTGSHLYLWSRKCHSVRCAPTSL
ncbi:hypothetical protein P692DRAFT_20835874 [Suillus brevipes Sb2]|nr:hypothetical protein P692DRAFT_20835874 [Suillus brevipes Sb2]